MWYVLKAIVRRAKMIVSATEFKTYSNNGVGGWLGYFKDANGNVVAFVDANNRLVFNW